VVWAQGNVRLGDDWVAVRPHDLYLVRPGQVHASDDDNDARPHLWEFRLAVNRPLPPPFALSSLPSVLRDVRDPALLEVMRQLIDEFSGQQANWAWLCSLLGEQLLLRIARLAAAAPAPALARGTAQHAEAVARLRRYIHFHFHEPLTVEHLAQQARLSPRRLTTVFREVCGRSPLDYVIEVRLDRAAELLREGRLTVSQVADRTGFASVHYFSRVFRRRRGLSPSAFGRQVPPPSPG
jgi:AraC-like DNA-binding protein